MQLFLFIIFALSSITLQAQTSYTFHKFQKGDACYLLADNVNVRAEASSSAKVVDNLPIGTAIKIVAKDRQTLKLNGIRRSWYEISYLVKGSKKTGFVWGGLIATGSAKDDKSGVLFLYGLASLKKGSNEYNGEKEVQIRACKDNKELSKITFEATNYSEISNSLSCGGNRGVSNIDNILEYDESQEMCGGANIYVVIFFSNNKLSLVSTLYPGADAPYYFSDHLIFPEDENGVKGRIIHEVQEGYWEENDSEEGGKDVIEKHRKVECIWTGKGLKEIKVLIDKKEE